MKKVMVQISVAAVFQMMGVLFTFGISDHGIFKIFKGNLED
jgi:hypothetical protein